MQDAIRSVARERLDMALVELSDLDTKGPVEIEEAVHSTRKRCKEVRALARLVREPLGDERARFNELVRDAANELSSIRDAHAILGTLNDLLEACGRRNDPDLEAVRAVLYADAADASAGLDGGDPRIERARGFLLAARDRVRRWDIDDGSAWLRSGFTATYKGGRRDLKRARKRPTDERLHEWRKSAKTLWYQVRLVEPAAPSVLAPLAGQLHRLGDALGDDHDLAVLVAHIEADPQRFAGDEPTNKASELARSQQNDLRRRAFRLGASVYAEPTSAFVARIDRYWTTTLEQGPELQTGKIAELAAGTMTSPRADPPESL